jgi:Domain of unknown function (DUF1992)
MLHDTGYYTSYYTAMSLLDALAEQQIRDAQARGEFEDLPGSGAPLVFEDDALIPEELRAAYRLLKNAGFVPPELEHCREIRDVETLLLQARTDETRSSLLTRLNWLLSRSGAGRHPRSLHIENDYFLKVADRLSRIKNTD